MASVEFSNPNAWPAHLGNTPEDVQKAAKDLIEQANQALNQAQGAAGKWKDALETLTGQLKTGSISIQNQDYTVWTRENKQASDRGAVTNAVGLYNEFAGEWLGLNDTLDKAKQLATTLLSASKEQASQRLNKRQEFAKTASVEAAGLHEKVWSSESCGENLQKLQAMSEEKDRMEGLFSQTTELLTEQHKDLQAKIEALETTRKELLANANRVQYFAKTGFYYEHGTFFDSWLRNETFKPLEKTTE